MLLRLTLSATLFGQLCQNVMHWIPKSANPENDPDVLRNAGADSKLWVQTIRPLVNTNVIYFRTEVHDITNGSAGALWVENYQIAGAGQNDHAAQLNACEVLRFETGLAGRRNRGRQYVPGMSPGFTQDGLLTADRVAAWQVVLTNLKDRFTQASANANYALVIHGRGQPVGDAKSVTEISLRTTPGSMRRRMVGVGV